MKEMILFLLSINWIDWLTRLVTVASVITAVTPTPTDDSVLKKIYKAIEVLALVIGKAKDFPPMNDYKSMTQNDYNNKGHNGKK